MTEPDDKTLILAYLLGRLDAPAKQQFESRYFTEDALFDEVQAMEHELFEDYLDNGLVPDQRKALEEAFRENPRRRLRLEFLRAMRKLGKAPARLRLNWWHGWAPALAAATLVVTAGLGMRLWDQNRHLRRELAAYTGLPSERASAPIEHITLAAPALTELSRGEGPGVARVSRRKDAAVVEITILFPKSAAAPKSAVLQNADGEELASQGKLSTTAADGFEHVTVSFPASFLPQGSYVIRLRDSRGHTIESLGFDVLVE